MRVLLDTNIIIHREASKVINPDIGTLFQWLDRLRLTKCIHPITIDELNRHKDADAVKTINIKITNYNTLKTVAPFDGEIRKLSNTIDTNENDINDSKILNEVYCGRVDILISEDKKIHKKAELLNIAEKVFKIDEFLEKVTAENPDFSSYKVLSVKESYFGNIDLNDSFFDSFREDYQFPPFNDWFNKKSDERAYVCYQDTKLTAFLFIKTEDKNEVYQDIFPPFKSKKRLKIGTFKVVSNGYKIGERFLKIIFDNALRQKVDEIYVTVFNKTTNQARLINLLEEWGFKHHGLKTTQNGQEQVYIREFNRDCERSIKNPRLTYPFISETSDVYIVPIYPEYHTELFPDSILNNEIAANFVDNEPHRNAIGKVYISRSYERGLKSGDIVVFYRTGDKGNAINTGVATTFGVVESVKLNIQDASAFLSICRKKSVFSDQELLKHWNYSPSNRPFVVNFLYVFSYRKRPNLRWLLNNGIINNINDMPRGFRKISRSDFIKIYEYSIS
jgi:predicted nucleic acid-binding protein